METIHSAINAAVCSIYGPEGPHEEAESKPQAVICKPTEHQIRDETNITPPAAENQVPTLGPGQAIYLNKPIVTTTSETSKLTNESPSLQSLGLRSNSPPPKDAAAIGHRRADSGIGEEVSTGGIPEATIESGAHQGPRHGGDGGDVQRTAREIDDKSLTAEGHPRPVFVQSKTDEDDICRADGRDRVQFGDPIGSMGSLKPSGEPDPERPRQGSAGLIPYMDLGKQGSVPPGARIGTVQGGTVKDRQQELEAAQTAQSGGLGGIPLVFGTKGYDPTGTAQVQKEEHHSCSKPNVKSPAEDSNLPQAKSVGEDEDEAQALTHIPQREQVKLPQEDRDLQRKPGEEKTISMCAQKTGDSRPDADAVQNPPPTVQASPTCNTAASTQCPDEHPSSPDEPHSQGSTTSTATTRDISPMGPKGGVSHPGQDKHVSQETQGEEKKEGSGHLWIKSTGAAADGGDFDATKPGAGKEADRLLEKAGVHRSVDPKQKKGAEGDTKKGVKGVKGSQHDTTSTSGKPADPAHHPPSAEGAVKHGRLHIPEILHRHHDTSKDTAASEGGSAHKGGLGEKLEKLKEKVKLRKD